MKKAAAGSRRKKPLGRLQEKTRAALGKQTNRLSSPGSRPVIGPETTGGGGPSGAQGARIASAGSAALDRFAIAEALRELGRLIRASGGGRFRARAYERGAAALESLAEDFEAVVSERRLEQIPGIGRSLAMTIEELRERGTSRLLEKLRAELPGAVLELTSVLRLPLARARYLTEALGIDSIDALKTACEAGLVRELEGFGERTEARLLEKIARLEAHADETLLVHALPPAERLVEHLRSCPRVARAEIAGGLRRWTETVREVVVVVAARDPGAVIAHLRLHPPVLGMKVEAGLVQLRLADAPPTTVRIVDREAFGSTLVRATGSPAHVARLEMRGLSDEPLETEEEVYGSLGLGWIPPELREDAGEIEAGLAGDRFEDLLAIEDVRGFVHCHTVASDGRATVEEMAIAAKERGMELITITDHSPAAFYAGGLDEDRLRRQWDEIAAAQERVGIRILRGTEADILRDGALDWPARIVEELEIVIASVHQRWRLTAEEMTERLVRAMEAPFFKVWGHPLGRLVGRRPPIDCDVEAVLDAASRARVAIEVSGDPYRLDLEPRWIRAARARGIPFVVSVDAHSTRGLDALRFGVAMARRGGVRRREVLNTLDPSAFARAVHPTGRSSDATGMQPSDGAA